MAYVYQHVRLDNKDPFYIGIGSDNKGKYTRANRKSGRSKYWNNMVNKYGYSIDILFDGITWEEAKFIEIDLIKKIGRDNLVNLTYGGDGVVGHSPSIETRKKWSEQRKSKDYWTGRKHTEESKKLMSEKKIGNTYSKGLKLTEEQRKKISEKKKGSKSPKRKEILCINNNTIYESTEDAANKLGLNRSLVSRVAQGKRKNTKGFVFVYTQ